MQNTIKKNRPPLWPAGKTLRLSSPRSPSAFTLIEVMLAIAIMAVICGSIYQFTGTVLRSSSISMRIDSQEQSFAGLRRLLDSQLAALPNNETGTFIGVTAEDTHGHRDALRVVCPAGNAVLTPDAHGLYRITLGLDEIPKASGHYSLVMEREPWNEDEDSDAVTTSSPVQTVQSNATGLAKSLPSDSVRLLDNVHSLEISYYDPRLNAWQDNWNDNTLIPSLVRVRLAMENSGAPYEFVEQIPSGGIRRGLPSTVASTGVPGQAGTTVPTLPAGLTVPPPPPGGLTAPPPPPAGPPPSFPNHPVSFPNAPLNGGGVVPR